MALPRSRLVSCCEFVIYSALGTSEKAERGQKMSNGNTFVPRWIQMSKQSLEFITLCFLVLLSRPFSPVNNGTTVSSTVKHTLSLSLFVQARRLVRRHKNDSKWKLFILPKKLLSTRFFHFHFFSFSLSSPTSLSLLPLLVGLCCGNKNITFPLALFL